MELKIVSNTENNLLKRRDIIFSVIEDAATVSKKELVQELSKKLNLDPESVIVVKLDQSFGVRQSMGTAHAYQTREMLVKTEPKHLVDRLMGKKGEKKAEQPKPEAKEEKKEEKKEQKAKEEKVPAKEEKKEGKPEAHESKETEKPQVKEEKKDAKEQK